MVAISYDPVPTLASFAERFGITYPLLSDTGSEVIRAVGVEHVDIEAYNRQLGLDTTAKHAGLPHPGTFQLDRAGVVVAKHFAQAHRERPSATVLLADELRAHGADDERADSATVSGVPVRATLATATYHPMQLLECRVRLSVPAGRHVYTGGVPSGFTTLGIELSGPESLVVGDVRLPAGRPLHMAELGEDCSVLDGDIEVSVPFRIRKDEGDVELVVAVALQSCTGTDCLPPGAVHLALPLRAGGLLRP